MFNGIVSHMGIVSALEIGDQSGDLEIRVDVDLASPLTIGSSIAVNGACLTLKSKTRNCLRFDLLHETMERTNLDGLSPNDGVNLELPLKLTDEISGHLLSGHIHTTTKIEDRIDRGDHRSLAIYTPPNFREVIFSKGYIALNGCSLTVGVVEDDIFWIHLIPETLKRTTFKDCTKGSIINLECDQQTIAIVETVKRHLNNYPTR